MDMDEKEKGKQKVLAMNEILGDTYRSYRKAKGLTQEKSAELAKVTTEYLCKFENGIYNARANTIVDLCNSVDITPTQLFAHYFSHTNQGMVDLISEACYKLSQKDQKLVLDFIERLTSKE